MEGLEYVTKEIMEDYELIRQSGVTNMFDFYMVIQIAKRLQMKELSKLTQKQYGNLLMNFGKLMEFYDIKQK